MKKPSELVEDEALAIHSDDGTIGFHRYYGELQVIAANAGTDPRTLCGIGIPMSEADADKLYEHWRESIANREHNSNNPEQKRYPVAWDRVRIQHYPVGSD